MVEKVKPNLYVLRGGGGNTAAFITDAGVVLVDTKLPGWGQPLVEKLKTITPKPVITIINTHAHFDHVSGNNKFPNVEIVTHVNTKTYMEGNPVYKQYFNGGGMPTKTIRDTLTLGEGDERIELRYFGPAHTGGDTFGRSCTNDSNDPDARLRVSGDRTRDRRGQDDHRSSTRKARRPVSWQTFSHAGPSNVHCLDNLANRRAGQCRESRRQTSCCTGPWTR